MLVKEIWVQLITRTFTGNHCQINRCVNLSDICKE